MSAGGDDSLDARAARLFGDDPSDAETKTGGVAPASGSQSGIPGYRIIREISRGGQGVVYQAVQEGTKRKVAIKVLLEGGYASSAARKRFEREIELVAQLKHPNVIGIFHSGHTADGRQFCVMDYVRGVPLDHYVREKKLTLEAALELFTTVAGGVQYAHQRGIIHRDLKPSNILVDADGTPRILDFGLAKWVSAPVGTVVSVTQQVVGTLPYLSPEQARGNPDEIDTRTDVYALGVILYQLLTGHYPYPVVGQMADVFKHIAETEPTPPSRQWNSDSGINERSARRLRPGQCPIDDEVQTIVLRSLAKERERRYQSAGELARDIKHYLAGEAIEAKRDSRWYVLKKNLRRYRLPVAVAAAFVLVLIAFTIVLWFQAEKNRRLARGESAAKQAALRAKGQSELISGFLTEMLASADPANAEPGLTVRQLLERSAQDIDSGFVGEPAIAATLHQTIGSAYRGLGLYPASERHLRKALELSQGQYGDAHTSVADAQHALARVHYEKGEYEAAEQAIRKAHSIRAELSGNQDHGLVGDLNLLGMIRKARSALGEAKGLYLQALDLDRREAGDRQITAVLLSNLGILAYEASDLDEAERLYGEALRITRRTLRDGHPRIADLLNNLASTLHAKVNLGHLEYVRHPQPPTANHWLHKL